MIASNVFQKVSILLSRKVIVSGISAYDLGLRDATFPTALLILLRNRLLISAIRIFVENKINFLKYTGKAVMWMDFVT